MTCQSSLVYKHPLTILAFIIIFLFVKSNVIPEGTAIVGFKIAILTVKLFVLPMFSLMHAKASLVVKLFITDGALKV